jgi:uncharacterized protein (TIGR00296 family)
MDTFKPVVPFHTSMPGASEESFDTTDGAKAVELAREAVESYVRDGKRMRTGSMRDAFYARTGVFVRLQSTRGRGSLRGCAGGYESDQHLGDAIVEAAIQAASDDCCGSEVRPSELPNTRVSVCIVTNVLLTDDPLADIELGRHGASVEQGADAGWLYPMVPVENGWSAAEYLDRTCRTAGLAPTAWEDEDSVVTLFEGRVFREESPGGTILERTG